MSAVIHFCAQFVILCILFPTLDTAYIIPPWELSLERDFKYLGSVDSKGKVTLAGPEGKAISKAGKGEKRFYLKNDTIRWEDAFTNCKTMKGNLITIETKAKEAIIEKFLTNFTDITVWTSGRQDWKTLKYYFGLNTWATFLNFGDHIKFREAPAFRIAYHKEKKSHWDNWLISNRFEYICEI